MTSRTLDRLRASTALRAAARLGLVARGVFYLLLAALDVGVLLRARGTGQQANANGALQEVASSPVGRLLLAGAALGFAAFALVRLAGALGDDRVGRLRRLSTAGQALAYVALAILTTSFLLGARRTGSEQQQRATARSVLMLPAGRPLLVLVGLVVLAVCGWQLVVAARGHFADTLHLEQMSRPVRVLTGWTARIGIPARALAVAAVGVFLVVAGVRGDPREARGLDALLLSLAGSAWGRVLAVLVAAGFAVFAVYTFLEARYRQVSSGS